MNISVLQGLNLENPITTIKIELDSPIDSTLLEEISKLHPVLLEEYKLEGKNLTIKSKLPWIWIEIGKALNNLSNRDWSFDLTHEFIFKTIFYKLIFSMSDAVVLKAAMQEGLEITNFYSSGGIIQEKYFGKYNRYFKIGCGKEGSITSTFASSHDSNIAKQTQENKWSTNLVLDRLNLPISKWQEIKNHEDIAQVWENYQKPVVIKRATGSRGIGVITGIDTLEKGYKAFDLNQKINNSRERNEKDKKIIMQEQITDGQDYRILTINGKFELATRRIPAFVTGNGKSTIKNLIEGINIQPSRSVDNPFHTLKPIVIDDLLVEFIAEQNLTIDSILPKDKKIFVRKVASVSQGGTTEDVTDIVNNQIKLAAETLAQSINAYVLGIDVFCKDITKPLTRDNGIIIECNTKPEGYLNAFPAIGKQYPEIGKIFLAGLILKTRTKRIVYIGTGIKKAQTHLKKLLETNERVGMYFDNKLYIDDEVFCEKTDIIKGIQALKLNNSLDCIAFNLTLEEVNKNGLGFDQIDIIVINKDTPKEIIKKIEGYRNIGLIAKIELI
jgi:cyanophycin synthetase